MTTIKTYHQHILPAVAIAPADQASLNSAWVRPFADGYGANRAQYMLLIGNVATDNITAAVYQATSSTGTSAKILTGSSITAVTSAATEKLVTIEFGPDALDNLNGFTYVRIQVTVASAGTEPYGVIYQRYDLRNPGNTPQDSTYGEQIVVPNA